MERIVIRHLRGSKAHQIEEFSLKDLMELTVGRDPSSAIHYDLKQGDLVSRQHAKIIRDAPDGMEFYIIGVGSKNGTYVNHEKIGGPTRLAPGAVVQLGAGGPEFQFDIEPQPPTRIEDSGMMPSSPSLPGKTRKSVGLTTVQRLIGDRLAGSEDESRRYLRHSVVAMLGVIVLVAGVFVYLHRATQQAIQVAHKDIHVAQQGLQTIQKDRDGMMSPTQIAATYGPATVHIAVSWKLVSAITGGQVNHHYVRDERGRPRPGYVRLADGTIEPWLVPMPRKAFTMSLLAV